MELPDYWLPRPPMELDAGTRAAFDALDAGIAGALGLER